MLRRVFVANRGEIALRVIAACLDEGIETVLGASEADRVGRAARMADRVVCIGPAPASRSYLDQSAVIAAAIGTGCDAVHPGYGFLSESASFAEACEAAGLTFIGPAGATIRAMGDKIRARAVAAEAGLPVVPGTSEVGSVEQASRWAESVGYPVMLKAAAGGGGRGIKVARSRDELERFLPLATAEVGSAFGDARLYLEKYVERARHLEVQILADSHGRTIHVGCRDCSLQRRYQKLIEEAPPYLPLLPDGSMVLEEMCAHATRLAEAVDYRGAGTVEFILDQHTGDHYFLEMNTRIQVEHPVTEELYGVDLVAEQLRIASGEPLGLRQEDLVERGHVIECRITAEAQDADFAPSPGVVAEWSIPSGKGIRVDTHCESGQSVPVFYDSLLAKLVVSGRDRPHALRRMRRALSEFEVTGVETTIAYLRDLLQDPIVVGGTHDTKYVEGGPAT